MKKFKKALDWWWEHVFQYAWFFMALPFAIFALWATAPKGTKRKKR